jgi:hypothetical protein
VLDDDNSADGKSAEGKSPPLLKKLKQAIAR